MRSGTDVALRGEDTPRWNLLSLPASSLLSIPFRLCGSHSSEDSASANRPSLAVLAEGIIASRSGLWSQTAWVRIPGQSFTSCVLLSKSLIFSKPQFPQYKMGDKRIPIS